nr:hypothetical protein [Thermoflexibacter sp.]
LFSCQKEISPYWGRAEAKLNGSKWETEELMCGLDNRCSEERIWLIITKTDKISGIGENLSFSHLPKQKGKYMVTFVTLEDGSLEAYCRNSQIRANYTTNVGGDAGLDSYKILNNSQNYLEITDFDENSKELKGNINLSFIIATKSTLSTAPDTLRFTEGKFHARVQ